MFRTLLITAIIAASLTSHQAQAAEPDVHVTVTQHSALILDELVRIRRDLHRHPELAGQEQRTSAIVEAYLGALGLEVRTHVGGYGVVGILQGAQAGKAIAWRADMDAVRTDAPDSVPFESTTPGVRHVCGHDVHTVIGLGIANTLAHQVEHLSGTVYFLFQPAEETLEGAQAMIADGLFEAIEPDELYGLHVAPMDVGVVSAKPGLMFSHSHRLRLQFGKTDDLEGLASAVDAVITSQAFSRPGTEPWNLEKLVDPELGIAHSQTLYQNYLIISESLKWTETGDGVILETGFVTSEEAELTQLPVRIKARIAETPYADRLLSVTTNAVSAAVFNDARLTAQALASIRDRQGEAAVERIHGVIPFFNDDFAYFQQRVPGVYFFLGGSNPEQGIMAMPHAPDFAIDERSIEVGVGYFSSLILDRLGRPSTP